MPWKKIEPMEERIEFALKTMGTLNFRALCQEYGISAKTGYKWKERFLREGIRGMEEQSRRPQGHAKQLAEEEVCEIMRLKLAHMPWGPRKIRELYFRQHKEAASESTFKRVLERAGLTQKRSRRRSSEAGRLCNGRRAKAVNEVWTVDFKGWWRSWGKRCEPLTVRDELRRYVLEMRAPRQCGEVLKGSFNGMVYRRRFAVITARPLPVSMGFWGLVSSRFGGWLLASIWNGAVPPIPRTTAPMNDCTWTSAVNLKPLVNPTRRHWISGDKALTTSVRTNPWG